MRILYAVGKKCNMLERLLALDPIPSSSDAVLGDITAVSDMMSVRPFLFQAGDTDPLIDIYTSQVVNGTFETAFSGGVPGAGWNAGDATISRDTGTAIDTGSLKVGGGSGKRCWYDVKVPAGKAMFCSVFIYQYGQVACLNLDTGNWLHSSGSWIGSETIWHSAGNVTGNWNAGYSGAKAFTVESYVACGRKDEVTLRFYFTSTVTAGSFCYFDNFALWPKINLISIHSYDAPSATFVVYGFTGGGLPIELGSLPVAQPTTFLEINDGANGYQRYQIALLKRDFEDPTNWLAAEHPSGGSHVVGKIFMGEVQEIDHSVDADIAPDETGLMLSDYQERTGSPFGPGQSYLQTERQRRNRTITLLTPVGGPFPVSHADRSLDKREVVRQILERSRNGAYVSLFVTNPDGDDTSAMLCSIAEPDMEVSYNEPGVEQITLPLSEYPFPRIVG